MNYNKINTKWLIKLCFLSFITGLLTFTSKTASSSDGGGMYPVSLLKKLNLQKRGLNIPISKIFNPKGNSLINGIVRIGGCTGSFVSDSGLILTNHHCVFSHLKSHSTEEKNYMKEGFHAKTNAREIPLKGLTVRIMKDYKDVSKEVLEGVTDIEDPVKKQAKLRANQKKVEEKYQKQFHDMKIEVSEMLTGQSYVLFKYKMLKDLRLVYVPPRTVGEFGGSSDNWVWPRHTGDFSFVRAYVGKDGEPATYSKENVPFNPEVHMDINPKGVQPNDFVFILGYPGRTFRHRSSGFIRFHKQVQLPYIGDLFQWKVDQMGKLTQRSESLKIKYSPRMKSLSNVAKNYHGKLEAMERINLVEQRMTEENDILASLASNQGKNRKKQKEFLSVKNKLNSAYDSIIMKGQKIFWYYQLINTSNAFEMAIQVDRFSEEVSNLPDTVEINHEAIIGELRKIYNRLDKYTDSMFFRKLLKQGLAFKNKNYIRPLNDFFDGEEPVQQINQFINTVYQKEGILDTSELFHTIRENPAKAGQLDHPTLNLWEKLEPDFRKMDSFRRVMFSRIQALRPKYVNFKMNATEGLFVPDANSTLRLTYGQTKGYIPKDGVYYEPFTTLKGYKEKAEPKGDYKPFPKMMKAIRELNSSIYYNQDIKGVPLCMLYNTDTTGGNSGSPVLDKNGNLVGLNFDRTYQGTITDYAWSDQYSRSIGVDVRFILWYLTNVDQADHLLKEMDIS